LPQIVDYSIEDIREMIIFHEEKQNVAEENVLAVEHPKGGGEEVG
jgi:hypothetical protein